MRSFLRKIWSHIDIPNVFGFLAFHLAVAHVVVLQSHIMTPETIDQALAHGFSKMQTLGQLALIGMFFLISILSLPALIGSLISHLADALTDARDRSPYEQRRHRYTEWASESFEGLFFHEIPLWQNILRIWALWIIAPVIGIIDLFCLIVMLVQHKQDVDIELSTTRIKQNPPL